MIEWGMETHGRPSRRPGWDYGRAGSYFVTFVVDERRPCLRTRTGELTQAGEVVLKVWERLPVLYPRVQLDAIAVMADHVHAIIRLRDGGPPTALGEVVRGWKGASTRQIRTSEPSFGWQSHFHDRVVRSPEALAQMREYIHSNLRSLGPGHDSSCPPV